MPDTLAERLTAWRTLAEGLKSRFEEVAFIKPDHAELAGFVQQIDGLMLEADVHEGRFREAVRQLLLPTDDLADLEARLNALFAFTAKAELDPVLRRPVLPSPHQSRSQRRARSEGGELGAVPPLESPEEYLSANRILGGTEEPIMLPDVFRDLDRPEFAQRARRARQRRSAPLYLRVYQS